VIRVIPATAVLMEVPAPGRVMVVTVVMVEEAVMVVGSRTVAGRTILFWLIAAITFGGGTVGMTDVAPLWVRAVCAGIAAVGAIWMIVDSVQYSITTIRAARERRRSHGH
jgi:hypothetical protein